jgi:organic radical activating enzyme
MGHIFSKIKRYWKPGLSYGLGLRKSLAGPITVHIETTNICNFRCVYCPQSNPEDHFKTLGRGKMSFDDFTIILKKVINAWPLKEIVLTRDGEPLVHPQLGQFIAHASNMGLEVTIGSNGSYFDEDRVKELIDNGLTKVKGDFCSKKQNYEDLRKGGIWEDVLNGYHNLLKYAVDNNKKFHPVLVDLNSYGLSSAEEIRKSLGELKELFPFSEDYLSIGPAIMHNAFGEAQTIFSASNKWRIKNITVAIIPGSN